MNILKKPYNNIQYAEFAIYANNTQRVIRDINGDKYALLSNEIVQDSKIVDISQTQEYIKNKRLKEIQQEILQTEFEYESAMDMPIKFTNNKLYKPKWVEQTYINLIVAGQAMPSLFPKNIWDASELQENSVSMTLQDLINLSTFLGSKQNELFNIKKTKINQLLLEKASLEK